MERTEQIRKRLGICHNTSSRVQNGAESVSSAGAWSQSGSKNWLQTSLMMVVVVCVIGEDILPKNAVDLMHELHWHLYCVSLCRAGGQLMI